MSLLRRHLEPTERSHGTARTLAEAERGSRVRVLQISGRSRFVQRMAALGIVPGVLLTVVKPHGPAIVSLGGARIAIGQNAAKYVEIEIAD